MTTIRGVDAHCHGDLYDSPAEVVALAESSEIRTIAVTNAPAVFSHILELTRVAGSCARPWGCTRNWWRAGRAN